MTRIDQLLQLHLSTIAVASLALNKTNTAHACTETRRYGLRISKRPGESIRGGPRAEAEAAVSATRSVLCAALTPIAPFRQVVGSRAAALETLLVLRQVIAKARFSNLEQLVAVIRDAGRRLVEAQPKGLCMSSSHAPGVAIGDGED